MSTATTWTNPIIDAPGADPFILKADGRWWLITSHDAEDGRKLPIWVSDDLVEWTFVRGAVARGDEGAWNRHNFWAPEILHHDGRYWLYYTAKSHEDEANHTNRVGLAVADTPDGPYEDRGILIEHAALDASPFRDVDGQLWLYYVTEHGNSRGHAPGKIWVDRLLDPATLADEPTCLIERHGWQEGPVLWPDEPDGRYRLTFSLGAWTDGTYRVAQAVGERPDGPFVESETIIMRSTEAVVGPGHHNFFPGPDGETWVCYHGWDPAHTTRYPRIDRIEVAPDGELTSPAPTSEAQTFPS